MPNRNTLSHISNKGRARMIDVGLKKTTQRAARAEAWIAVGAAIAARLQKSGGIAKGSVLETARIAGIMAAKRTAELIPMCHPLPVDSISVKAQLIGNRVHIESEVRYSGKTGVEMEALTAVSVAALTVYDMCKAASKGIVIGPIRLLEKTGGKSGKWRIT
jgi:cyclic pyranopterin monophosphate synthase